MADSLRDRLREKMERQLVEDGPYDPDQDDPRQVSIATDLEALASVGDDDPLLDRLAERYLTP